MNLMCIIGVAAANFAFGVIAASDKYNKRTYCYGFIACIIALAILD